MAATCFFVLAVAFCVAVSSAAGEFINPYYKPPCAYTFHYSPPELQELNSRLLLCVKKVPSKNFPFSNHPGYDCATEGVDSLRDAPSRSVAGIPAVVRTCLRRPRYAALVQEHHITDALTCIRKSLAKAV